MKYLVAIFLLALAMGISAEEKGCIEKKAEVCIETMIVSIIADNGEDLSNTCGELKKAIDCLQAAVTECGDEDTNAKNVIEGIKQLENNLEENCGGSEAEEQTGEAVVEAATPEEAAKCVAENEAFIYECISDETADAIKLIKGEDSEEEDANALKCGMYVLMSACMIDRVDEKCGKVAAQLTEDDLSDPPQEIQDACEASENVVIQAFDLLAGEEGKRRKK